MEKIPLFIFSLMKIAMCAVIIPRNWKVIFMKMEMKNGQQEFWNEIIIIIIKYMHLCVCGTRQPSELAAETVQAILSLVLYCKKCRPGLMSLYICCQLGC